MAGLVPATHDLRGAASIRGVRRAPRGETEIMGPRDKPGDDGCYVFGLLAARVAMQVGK